ncbi:ECF RNA polymerase sigma factor SigW [Planctomyces sp. SH-PL62]|nr:ECF RNA polymerase sigma factor SigW [Planctomyces sp. SH-PL62]
MIERATDAILLKRFAEEREEAAFAELVERHGPLVRGVCRRLLRSEHDVEDVFQATFLLLALRASDVAWRASIGGWVRDVARRLALNARTEIARRRRRETPVSNLLPGLRFGETGALPDRACPLSVFTDEVERRDVRRVIDGEVDDLPEKYREPLVLCYLEGKTNHEAAAALGYPVGSMSRRLEKARGLLRKRLIGRGVTLGVVLALVGWLVATSPRPGGRPDPGPGSPPLGFAAQAVESSSRSELRELLAALQRNDGNGLGRDRLGLAVRHAAEAAELAPAASRERLLGFAAETRLAALDLSGIGPDDDRADVPRLLATCVRCHVALH